MGTVAAAPGAIYPDCLPVCQALLAGRDPQGRETHSLPGWRQEEREHRIVRWCEWEGIRRGERSSGSWVGVSVQALALTFGCAASLREGPARPTVMAGPRVAAAALTVTSTLCAPPPGLPPAASLLLPVCFPPQLFRPISSSPPCSFLPLVFHRLFSVATVLTCLSSQPSPHPHHFIHPHYLFFFLCGPTGDWKSNPPLPNPATLERVPQGSPWPRVAVRT